MATDEVACLTIKPSFVYTTLIAATAVRTGLQQPAAAAAYWNYPSIIISFDSSYEGRLKRGPRLAMFTISCIFVIGKNIGTTEMIVYVGPT